MATSPLFGWEEPDDTDLVKDGAAAIRTLGNAIDTSMGDLLGGTTGQVLSKASNTDMDFTWVAQDDSNAIQNAIVDAKGDLIAASAADTPARLAVGSDGSTLVADSAASTGLAWKTPATLYPWTAYTPTVTGGSAFTLGNGTLTGRYVQIGKTVTAVVNLTCGSTTVIPNTYTIFSPPVAAANVYGVGSCIFEDVGGNNYAGNVSFFTTNFLPFVPTAGSNSVFMTPTIPFTWASGDVFKMTMTYEAA